MKEKIIDTNIILRFLVKDVPEQFEKSKQLIGKIESREESVVLPLLCAFEAVFTLEKYYKTPRKEIAEKLTSLLSLKNLHLERKGLFFEALNIYSTQKKVSFADAFVVTEMNHSSIKEIYSFDEDFDLFKEIKRLEP